PGIIAQARLLEDLRSKEKERRDYRRRMVTAIKRLQAYEKTTGRAETAAQRSGRTRLHGLPAAPGFGRGKAHLLQPPVSFDLIDETRAEHPDDEKRRFRRAVKESAAELTSFAQRLTARMPEFDRGILDGHRMMLED